MRSDHAVQTTTALTRDVVFVPALYTPTRFLYTANTFH